MLRRLVLGLSFPGDELNREKGSVTVGVSVSFFRSFLFFLFFLPMER